MGIHQRELIESYPMNTNTTGFKCFFKNLCILVFWAMGDSSLSTGRLKPQPTLDDRETYFD